MMKGNIVCSYVCTYVNYLGKLSKMYENTSKKQDQLGIYQIDNQTEFFFRCQLKARDFFN